MKLPTLHLNEDHAAFLSALNVHGAKYLLVGGYAFGAYCEPRATKDLDVYILSEPSNGELIFRALAEFGVPLQDISPADFCDGRTVFQIGLPPLRVDVLQLLSGVTFEECWADRVLARVNDAFAVPVISLERLIANKGASGRPQDLLDIKQLKRMRELIEQNPPLE